MEWRPIASFRPGERLFPGLVRPLPGISGALGSLACLALARGLSGDGASGPAQAFLCIVVPQPASLQP